MADEPKLPAFRFPLPPPPPAVPGTGLESIFTALAELAKNINSRYYKNQVIYVDGYTFTNCCFHNCALVTDLGTFSLRSCTIANCQFRYGPNALRILRLWHLTEPTLWEEFKPQIAHDGAVTIE